MLATLLLAFGIGAASFGGKGARAIGEALADPISVLAGRSPGARDAGALTQTKPTRARTVAAIAPQERVLNQVRTRPDAPGGATGPGTLAVDPTTPVDAIETPADYAEAPGGNPGAVFGPLEPGIAAGPGPGAVIIPSDGGGGTTAPEAAVPEPATWATLMLGLFTVGAALRRRRRRAPRATG